MKPRIALLTGAGFPRSAGVPTSIELAQTFNEYIEERAKGKGPRLLTFLHFYLEGGIRLQRGKLGLNPSTAINIEQIAVAARQIQRRELDPLAPYISGWHPHLHEMLSREPQLLETYLDCFNDHLRGQLQVPDHEKIAYIDRLAEIACEFEELDIFSLNYDCCIEQALTSYCKDHQDIEFIDGFNESGWNPELFRLARQGAKIVRLYKMHGSLDWVNSEEFGLVSLAKIRNEIAEELTGLGPHLVFGTNVKLTGQQPFFTMAHLFYENMIRADVLVVIGYSFQDDYINSLVKQCQRQNSRLKIVVVDKCAGDIERNVEFLKAIRVYEFITKTAEDAIANHWLKKRLAGLTARRDDEAPF